MLTESALGSTSQNYLAVSIGLIAFFKNLNGDMSLANLRAVRKFYPWLAKGVLGLKVSFNDLINCLGGLIGSHIITATTAGA